MTGDAAKKRGRGSDSQTAAAGRMLRRNFREADRPGITFPYCKIGSMAHVVARLEIQSPDGLRSVSIELGGVCSIGRGTQNTIMLEDSSVSRKHAIIDCQSNNDCYVTDAGSRTGTFINEPGSYFSWSFTAVHASSSILRIYTEADLITPVET